MQIINSLTNILVMIIIIMLLVVIHELGHARATRKHGGYVPEFGIGFFPGSKSLWSWFSPKTKTNYHIKPWPLGGYIIPADENYEGNMYGHKKFKDFTFLGKVHVLLNGVLYNFYLAAMIIIPLGMINGVPIEQNIVIKKVETNSLAEKLNIRKNDIITKINNINITEYLASNSKLMDLSRDNIITIKTSDISQNTIIIPKQNSESKLGIEYRVEAIKVSNDILTATNNFFQYTKSTFMSIIDIFTLKNLNNAQSIIGATSTIGDYSDKISQIGDKVMFYLNVMASISLSLMVFNLLPIPALDGGQILLVIIEKIRRKELSSKMREKILQYSFLFVILLGVLLMLKDLMGVIGKWFGI